MFKSSFILLLLSVALLSSGPIEQLVAHGRPYGGVAWAQDATDAEQSDDVSSEPAVKPPIIGGDWFGKIQDDSFGGTTFTINIFQKNTKLRGDWSTGAGASGSFTAKFKADGQTLIFKFKAKHSKCKVAAIAMLTNMNGEIQGTYTAKKCTGATKGMFDLTFQQ